MGDKAGVLKLLQQELQEKEKVVRVFWHQNRIFGSLVESFILTARHCGYTRTLLSFCDINEILVSSQCRQDSPSPCPLGSEQSFCGTEVNAMGARGLGDGERQRGAELEGRNQEGIQDLEGTPQEGV